MEDWFYQLNHSHKSHYLLYMYSLQEAGPDHSPMNVGQNIQRQNIPCQFGHHGQTSYTDLPPTCHYLKINWEPPYSADPFFLEMSDLLALVCDV